MGEVKRRVTVVEPIQPMRINTPTSLVSKAIAYLSLTGEAKAATERATVLKKDMMDSLHTDGEADEKGHRYLYFKDPINVGGKKYAGVKRERRVSTLFDEDTAEQILTQRGLLEQCQRVVTTTVLDQDEIYVLNQEGKISDAELDSMFSENESFAFKPVTE